MTKQEAFDKVWAWLAREDASRCVEIMNSGLSKCVYDNGRGNHCAIGGLMLDVVPQSNRAWEFVGPVDCLLAECVDVRTMLFGPGPLDEDTVMLLSHMQMAHDSPGGWDRNGPFAKDEWKDAALRTMREIAYSYKLEVPA